MDSPLVSVIIPTANRYSDLFEALTMLRRQTYQSLEIIVIDNNSKDETQSIKKEFPEVKYVRLPKNLFNVPSRNIGISNANGKYIFCIDDDSFPGYDCLESAVNYMEGNENVGIVSFGVKNYDRFFDYDSYKKKSSNLSEGIAIFGWSGCGGLLRTSHFKKYGYWPETGSRSLYEIISCIWAWNEKQLVCFYEDCFVFHKVSAKGDAAKVRVNKKGISDSSFAIASFILTFYAKEEGRLKMKEWLWQNISGIVERRSSVYLFPMIKVFFLYPWILKASRPFSNEVMSKVRIVYNFKGK
jgi:glycosyltransferase involved in cell wall biosynthesis